MTYSLYALLADAILAFVLVLGIGLGWRRGFIRTVAKPVKLVGALVISVKFCTPLAQAWLEPVLCTPIKERLSAFLTERCANLTAQNATEELPTLLKLAAGLFNIDITEVAEGAGTRIIESIVNALATPVAHVTAVVFCFVILYLASQLLLTVAFWLVNMIFHAGVLGVANRLVGVVFGALFALLIAWAAVALAELVFGMPSMAESPLADGMRDGFLYRFFDKHGPLDLLLSF